MIFLRDRLSKKNSILDGVIKNILPVIIIICLSVFNAQICQADDIADILEDVNKTAVPSTEDAAEEPAKKKPDSSSGTTVTNTSMPSDEAVFIGLGVAGLAALALALGSSGSDDAGPALPPPVQVDPVGPGIGGTWSGRLVLVNHGAELVTATVVQNGADVQITTSTSLPYGKQFTGTISGSGSMYMFDGTTGETWTTFGGNATANRLSLYDYVNNFEDLDRLELTR